MLFRGWEGIDVGLLGFSPDAGDTTSSSMQSSFHDTGTAHGRRASPASVLPASVQPGQWSPSLQNEGGVEDNGSPGVSTHSLLGNGFGVWLSLRASAAFLSVLGSLFSAFVSFCPPISRLISFPLLSGFLYFHVVRSRNE